MDEEHVTCMHAHTSSPRSFPQRPTTMGDFSAGKMLVNGVELALVTAADFDQFSADMDGCQAFAEMMADTQRMVAEIPVEFYEAGTSGELLNCLKQWNDAGLSICVTGCSFAIDSAVTIAQQAPPADDQVAFLIGADMDGEGLYMTTTGMLHTGTPEALAPLDVDLSQALTHWRHDAITKRIEWAEGWIEAA